MQAKEIMTHYDPLLLNLQEELAQAQLVLEQLEQENVSWKKYQELQKQLQEMNTIKSETFDRCRKVEQKMEKIKLKLDRVRQTPYAHCIQMSSYAALPLPIMPFFC